MKFTKILLTAIGAAAVMNLAAFADDMHTVTYSKGGATFALYRNSEPTIAVFTGRGVGTSTSGGELQTVSKDNGHGQSSIMHRQVQ